MVPIWCQFGVGGTAARATSLVQMSRRSYGSGSLLVRADRNGRETWYGSWRVSGRRVKRRIGLKRTPSCSDGLTHVQAEQTMRRFMAEAVALPGQRYTGSVGRSSVAPVRSGSLGMQSRESANPRRDLRRRAAESAEKSASALQCKSVSGPDARTWTRSGGSVGGVMGG